MQDYEIQNTINTVIELKDIAEEIKRNIEKRNKEKFEYSKVKQNDHK